MTTTKKFPLPGVREPKGAPAQHPAPLAPAEQAHPVLHPEKDVRGPAGDRGRDQSGGKTPRRNK